jgi:hypothetical protein
MSAALVLAAGCSDDDGGSTALSLAPEQVDAVLLTPDDLPKGHAELSRGTFDAGGDDAEGTENDLGRCLDGADDRRLVQEFGETARYVAISGKGVKGALPATVHVVWTGPDAERLMDVLRATGPACGPEKVYPNDPDDDEYTWSEERDVPSQGDDSFFTVSGTELRKDGTSKQKRVNTEVGIVRRGDVLLMLQRLPEAADEAGTPAVEDLAATALAKLDAALADAQD